MQNQLFLGTALVILTACETPPEPGPATPAAPAPVASMAPAATVAPIKVTTAPAIDTSCLTDDDCTMTNQDLSGSTTCCVGCTWHPASKNSLADFKKACVGAPTQACQPVTCKTPIATPKCNFSKCLAVVGP